MRSGGRSPTAAEILAPILLSGSIIRAMGRRESDSSPSSSLVNSWPARMPVSIRMVEPEFPQSSTSVGAFSIGPRPQISTTPSTPRCHSTPSPRRQPSVLEQSMPVE